MALISTLTGNFSQSPWVLNVTGSGCSAASDPTRMVTAISAALGYADTGTTGYDLTGSSFTWKWSRIPFAGHAGGPASALSVEFRDNGTATTGYRLLRSATANTWTFQKAGVAVGSTWTDEAMRNNPYCRIRESGGTTYFEYSPNGTTWSQPTADQNTANYSPITNLRVRWQPSAVNNGGVSWVEQVNGSAAVSLTGDPTIRLMGQSTTAAAAALNTAPAVPAGIASNDLSLLIITGKLNTGVTATSTTPSGWTAIGTITQSGTAATNGVDTGDTAVAMYYRTGTYSAPTISTTNFNSMASSIVVFRSSLVDAGGTWDLTGTTTGSDTASGANIGITGAAGVAMETGDIMLAAIAASGDIGTPSAWIFTGMTGATQLVGGIEPAVNRAVTTGNDSRATVMFVDIVGGSSTDAPQAGYTNASSTTGHARFLRIRDVPRPKFDTLTDDFATDQLATKWPQSYGTYSVSGGVLNINSDTAYHGVRSATGYTLLGSEFFAKITPPSAGTSTTEAFCEIVIDAGTDGTDVTATVNTVTGILYLQSRTGYSDGSRVELTYSPTDHAWLKISESGGTVTWWTSATGAPGSWTSRRTAATPTWMTSGGPQRVTIASHRNDGTGTNSIADNVNVAGTGLTTVTDSLASSFNVIAAITDALASSFNITAAVTDSAPSSFNAATTVGDSHASAWSVAAVVADSQPSAFRTTGRATGTSDSAFHVRTAASDSQSSAFHVAATATDSQQIDWNVAVTVITTVTDTMASAWTAAATVQDSQPSAFHARQTATDSQASAFHVRIPVTDTQPSAFHVRTGVTDSQASAFHTAGRITDTSDIAFHVRITVTGTAPSEWPTLITASDSQASAFHDLASVSGTSPSAWSTMTLAADTAPSAFHTVGRIVDTATSAWFTLTSASDSQASAFHARATVVDGSASAWYARQSVTDSAPSSWAARSPVTDTAASAWHTIGRVVDSSPSSWNVLSSTGVADYESFAWHTRSTTGDNASSSWYTLTAAADSTTSAFAVRQIVQDSSASGFAVRALVPDFQSSVWFTASTISDSTGSSFNVGSLVTDSSASSWDVRSPAGVLLPSTYLTLAPADVSTDSLFRVLAAASQTAGSAWNVLMSLEQVLDEQASSWYVRASVPGSSDSAWFVRSDSTALIESLWNLYRDITGAHTGSVTLGSFVSVQAGPSYAAVVGLRPNSGIVVTE